MKGVRRSKQWRKTVETSALPPIRCIRETISVRKFSFEIEKFLERHFTGSYSIALEEVSHRELYISFDSFVAFIYSNFAAAGYSFQNIHISSHIDGKKFLFIMEYDTSLITDRHRENMEKAAERSGFEFCIGDGCVMVTMAVEMNFALDVFSLQRQPLYNAFVRIFSLYGEFEDQIL
ncbi:MAG: hypothetical protein IKD45_05395 [Clostridia bacterium]|nr:hypothetical protein [Clostridia bacterium]